MNLTEREKAILKLAGQGLSDYKIARKINTDPPSVTRSRKNAYRKLMNAVIDIEWTAKMGLNFESNLANGSGNLYSFFL
jgi:DNA-binding NarL/FixJ family response regulator